MFMIIRYDVSFHILQKWKMKKGKTQPLRVDLAALRSSDKIFGLMIFLTWTVTMMQRHVLRRARQAGIGPRPAQAVTPSSTLLSRSAPTVTTLLRLKLCRSTSYQLLKSPASSAPGSLSSRNVRRMGVLKSKAYLAAGCTQATAASTHVHPSVYYLLSSLSVCPKELSNRISFSCPRRQNCCGLRYGRQIRA